MENLQNNQQQSADTPEEQRTPTGTPSTSSPDIQDDDRGWDDVVDGLDGTKADSKPDEGGELPATTEPQKKPAPSQSESDVERLKREAQEAEARRRETQKDFTLYRQQIKEREEEVKKLREELEALKAGKPAGGDGASGGQGDDKGGDDPLFKDLPDNVREFLEETPEFKAAFLAQQMKLEKVIQKLEEKETTERTEREQTLREREAQIEREMQEQLNAQIKAKHPDADEIRESPRFHDWLAQNRNQVDSIRNKYQAGDPQSPIEIIALYKTDLKERERFSRRSEQIREETSGVGFFGHSYEEDNSDSSDWGEAVNKLE